MHSDGKSWRPDRSGLPSNAWMMCCFCSQYILEEWRLPKRWLTTARTTLLTCRSVCWVEWQTVALCPGWELMVLCWDSRVHLVRVCLLTASSVWTETTAVGSSSLLIHEFKVEDDVNGSRKLFEINLRQLSTAAHRPPWCWSNLILPVD